MEIVFTLMVKSSQVQEIPEETAERSQALLFAEVGKEAQSVEVQIIHHNNLTVSVLPW